MNNNSKIVWLLCLSHFNTSFVHGLSVASMSIKMMNISQYCTSLPDHYLDLPINHQRVIQSFIGNFVGFHV